MNSKSAALHFILDKAGINTRKVTVLGSFAHIDTFEKYENKLLDLMSNGGFVIRSVSNGVHLDGVDGFRMVFQLRG